MTKYQHQSVPFFGPGKSWDNDGTWERDPGPWGTVILGLGTLEPGRKKPKKGDTRDIVVKADDVLGKIPGVCEVKISRGRKSNKTSAFRGNGAVIQPQGVELASVTITVRIWTRTQLEDMLDMLDRIDPRIGAQGDDPSVKALADVQAYDIQHPKTRMRKIHAIYIDKVDGPDADPSGMLTFTISATQWVPIADKPKATKPVDKSLGLTGGTVTDNRSQVGGNLGQFAPDAPPKASPPGSAR